MTTTLATTTHSWQVPVGKNLRLAGEEYGSGNPPVALLHGLGSCRCGWDPVAPRLATRRRVLCWDHRGHGDSDTPTGPYSIARLVADTATILNTLHAGPAVLVGHGLGAAVALTVAASHPHLVAGVACVQGGLYQPRRGLEPGPRHRHRQPTPADDDPTTATDDDGEADTDEPPEADEARDAQLARSLHRLDRAKILGAVAAAAVPVLAITAADEDTAEGRRLRRQSMRRAREVLGDQLLELPMSGTGDLPTRQPEALTDALEALAWLCADHRGGIDR